MDYKPFFDMQRELDQNIYKKHNLEPSSLLNKKLIALGVELSEFMNELKSSGFKYWTVKPMNREKALEEYVDCLHFIFSIGNDLNVSKKQPPVIVPREGKLLDTYITIKKILYFVDCEEYWIMVFSLFQSLGAGVGFSQEEIFQAYRDKLEVNYKRLEANY